MADLNALLIFAKVADAKSFSAAARQLGMPVSTVSRQVAELEKALGRRLLVRSTRSVQLTEDGSRIIQQARSLAEVDAAVDRVTRELREPAATLRLLAPPNISDTVLAPLIAAFQASFPEIGVKVFISGQIAETFAEGMDLEVKIGSRRVTGLVSQTLISYRHQLVASPEYLRSAKPVTAPHDLLDHPLLAFAFPSPENSWTLTDVHSHETEIVRFRPNLAMSDYAGLTSVMLEKGGIGDLPPVVQPELLRLGRLQEVLTGWTLPMLDLCLVHPPARELSKPLRTLKDFAGEFVPRLFSDLPT